MPRTKVSVQKKKKVVAKNHDEETEDVAAIPIQKIAKVAEIDIPEDVVGIVEEKAEVDPLLVEDDSDESTSDEAGLDDEEINPFGDKWEV